MDLHCDDVASGRHPYSDPDHDLFLCPGLDCDFCVCGHGDRSFWTYSCGGGHDYYFGDGTHDCRSGATTPGYHLHDWGDHAPQKNA